MTYHPSVGPVHHLAAMTGYRAVMYLQTDKLAPQSFGFLLLQSLAPHKTSSLVELNKYAESGLKRSDLVGKFVAIKRKTHLETQSVATSQTTRRAAPRIHKLIPEPAYSLMVGIYLEAILTGVARAAYDQMTAILVKLLERVECKLAARQTKHFLHHAL